VAAGTPLSIVDMGLVTSVEDDRDGRVRVSIRTTSPMCDLAAPILQAAEETVLRVPGVTQASVTLDSWSSWWTEADMSDAGREALEAGRQSRRLKLQIEPLQWTRQRKNVEDQPQVGLGITK
jgi:metal-sulfur cluster biosynthetic enzyme